MTVPPGTRAGRVFIRGFLKMVEISRNRLFGKLDTLAYKSVESATVFCKLRGNPYVEMVHWIHQIFQLQDSDLHRIVRYFGLDASRLAGDITALLETLPRGATSISDFSPHLEEAVQQGWLYSTLMFNASSVRTGHLMIAMLTTQRLRNLLYSLSRQFEAVKPEALAENFHAIVGGSPEDEGGAADGSVVGGSAVPGEASGAMSPAEMGKQEALRRFATDLTAQARSGKMDPISGRDNEIRQIIDILMRRRQNNPILTGEAGVGKTAVVEGFAQRIVRGDVPPALRNVRLLTLDIGLLQAGASMKGEFEERLKQVIEEVQASDVPIILFIDEAHTLIGAGGAAGSGDAANLLKPALARGTLRTIAATTWSEYKKYIEKDPALTRRFQVIQVDEPDIDKGVMMMRSVASQLEKHHGVMILDEALEAAVSLSARYIPARQLPDKAVSLLDTSCARVAVSQSGTPALLEDASRRLDALVSELGIVEREESVGVRHGERSAELRAKIERGKKDVEDLSSRTAEEKAVVVGILDLRRRLREAAEGAGKEAAKEAAAAPAAAPAGKKKGAKAAAKAPAAAGTGTGGKERAAMLEELSGLTAKLSALQGDRPMILPSVDAQAVASVVADWTGIPVGRMVKNELRSVLSLADTLGERVIGQRHALETISKRLQTSRAGLDDPGKPVGVFLLVGPSGVGKTETALALGEVMYGGEQNVITINMSEFQEAHTVSTLKGAPPGYVGYGEGGVLTEAVRRKPYSVVLLDEVEKAHRDVHEIFFQVFDKGWMEDGEGRLIDFKNTVIILTSNAGTELINKMCKDPDLMPDPEGLTSALHEPLIKVFPAALLGRLVVVPFYPINDRMIEAITRLKIGRIAKRMREMRKMVLVCGDDVVALIVRRCTEVDIGARTVDAILSNTMLPEISREYLSRTLEGGEISKVTVSVDKESFRYDFA